ncbi:MAG: chalcone isomerase family protein [Kiritimatiellae bacterium]|nr:chalcone isomerase family protein [Kiritimatiellia bacterium]
MLAVWAAAANAQPVPIVSVAGRRIPSVRMAEGTRFSLHGAGVLKKGLILSVYAAALYLPEGTAPERVLEDVPKRLEVHYLHRTPKRLMIRTAEETLARNFSPAQLEALRPNIDRLHAAYEDGRKGGMAALTYTPRGGMVFSIDGREKVRIAGAEFAAAYLRVWLGNPPNSETVKQQLLTKWKR